MRLYNCAVVLIALCLMVGCAAFNPLTAGPSDCIMQDWHQAIDQLPEPPFAARSRTGIEFMLIGVVRDAATCAPLPGVTVMFDMTNAAGQYDGVQQGTAVTNALGLFLIRSDRPGAYGGGPAHIHLFVGAPGYTPITAAHNLVTDDAWGTIALTLDAVG